jgi:hypothetical protein
MRQLPAPIGLDGLQQIAQNVSHMRHERDCLEVRQLAIRRTLRKIERQLSMSDDLEEVESLQDILDNLCVIGSDLETYRSHLETELDKVIRGMKTLKSLRGKHGRKAFAEYVTEDTELSVQNLRQVRSYYDQVIATIKDIA